MGKAVGKRNPHEETRKDEKISGSSARRKGMSAEEDLQYEIDADFFKSCFCGISNTGKCVATRRLTGNEAISFYS